MLLSLTIIQIIIIQREKLSSDITSFPHRTLPPVKTEKNEAYGRVTVEESTSHYETVHHEETI